MAKVKGDITIGQRMSEEVDRLFPSLEAATKALHCDAKSIWFWRQGTTPGSFHLAKLYYCHGDVIYVLTGKRSV